MISTEAWFQVQALERDLQELEARFRRSPSPNSAEELLRALERSGTGTALDVQRMLVWDIRKSPSYLQDALRTYWYLFSETHILTPVPPQIIRDTPSDIQIEFSEWILRQTIHPLGPDARDSTFERAIERAGRELSAWISEQVGTDDGSPLTAEILEPQETSVSPNAVANGYTFRGRARVYVEYFEPREGPLPRDLLDEVARVIRGEEQHDDQGETFKILSAVPMNDRNDSVAITFDLTVPGIGNVAGGEGPEKKSVSVREFLSYLKDLERQASSKSNGELKYFFDQQHSIDHLFHIVVVQVNHPLGLDFFQNRSTLREWAVGK